MDTHQNIKSNSIETIENEVPKIMCHVCNINVPVIYLKEHYKSIKHTTCLDIANNAIERIQKNTIRRNFEIDKLNVLNQTTYFCESCVTIIANKDKKEHEKSKYHLQMVKRDNLLNELSKVYIGRDKTAIDKICYVKAEIQNDAEIKTRIHDTDTINLKENKNVAIKKEISAIRNTAEEITDDLSNVYLGVRKKIDAALYMRIATIIYNTLGKKELTTHFLNVVDNDYIEVHVKNGTVKVLMQNFHGLKDMGQNNYVCLLCNVVGINKTKHEDREHIFTPNHIKKVMTPIKSIHCIRQVDDEWSHCLICNHLITNSGIRRNIHTTNNLEHSFKLEHALVNLNEEARGPEPSETKANQQEQKKKNLLIKKTNMRYCDICNIVLNVNNMFSHLQGIKHELNLKKKQQESVCRTGALGGNKEFMQQLSELATEELVEEKVIKTEVDTQNIHEVVYSQGDEHITNFKKEEHEMETKTLSTTNMERDIFNESVGTETESDNFIDEELSSEASSESISEETDTEWENEQDAEEFIYRNSFARIHEDTINCKLCNIELPIQKRIIKQHLKEAKHKSLYHSALILNMINVIDDDCYCEICELHMKKGFEFEHISGLLHEKNKYNYINIEKKIKLIGTVSQDSDICNVCKLYVGAHNMDMHIKGKKHLAKLKDKHTEYYYCDICKVEIIAQLASIETHYNGEKHNNNVSKLINDHKIQITNLGECFCETCEVKFSKLYMFKHVQSCNHIMLLNMS